MADEGVDGDDDAPLPSTAAGGVELTPEELAAIREATKPGAAEGAVMIVSRPEDRERWITELDGFGLDLAFVADPHQLLVALRDRAVQGVIVDADACPSGGLPALAVLRSCVEMLGQRVIVASRPTRTHVVSCLAAGATSYLSRPFAVEQLVEQLRA